MLIEFNQQQQDLLTFNPEAYLILFMILFPLHKFTGHKIGKHKITKTKAIGKSISTSNQATNQKQGFLLANSIGHVQKDIMSLNTLHGIVFN